MMVTLRSHHKQDTAKSNNLGIVAAKKKKKPKYPGNQKGTPFLTFL